MMSVSSYIVRVESPSDSVLISNYILLVQGGIVCLYYFILVSKDLQKFYRKELLEYKVKCVYIPNTLENIPKTKSTLTAKRIVSVGRLSKEKGYLSLLEIYSEVIKKHPDWVLDIIGDGKEKETTKKQNELQTLNATLTRNKMKIESLIDRMAIIDVDLINDVALQVKDLKSKNIEMEKRIAELTKEVSQETDQREIASLALDMINKYMSSFDTLDIVDKRIMIKLLVSSVESDGEHVYINYIGSSNTAMCPRSEGSRSSS